VSASQQNEVNFSIPKLTFIFTQGITEDLAGVVVVAGVLCNRSLIAVIVVTVTVSCCFLLSFSYRMPAKLQRVSGR
jgi:hypothetical protein